MSIKSQTLSNGTEFQPWIGLTDRIENEWKWINGTRYSIDRSHWESHEPDNNPDSDGVYITNNYKFGDHPNHLKFHHYLFEPTFRINFIGGPRRQ